MEKYFYSYEQFILDRMFIYNRINLINKTSNPFIGIVSVLRGGFYLGDYLSRKLDIPNYFLRCESYGNDNIQKEIKITLDQEFPIGKYLICEDIIDTGKTIDFIKSKYKQHSFYYASLISNKEDGKIISPNKKLNDWIDFFWEKT